MSEEREINVTDMDKIAEFNSYTWKMWFHESIFGVYGVLKVKKVSVCSSPVAVKKSVLRKIIHLVETDIKNVKKNHPSSRNWHQERNVSRFLKVWWDLILLKKAYFLGKKNKFSKIYINVNVSVNVYLPCYTIIQEDLQKILNK